MYLEIADVHDYANVTLNGKEVGARSFQPYRWDVTSALKKGANDLKIEVYANVAQARPAAAPPAGAAPAATAALPVHCSCNAAWRRRGTRCWRLRLPVSVEGHLGQAAQDVARADVEGLPGAGAAAGTPGAGAPPAGFGGGGRGTPAAPAASGLLGPVKLMAY